MNQVIEQKVEVEGRYKMVAIRPDGSERVLADWFPNLILNAGLDSLALTNPANLCYRYCQVGSGTATPTVNDTQLQSRIAGVVSATFGQYQQDATGIVTTSPRYAYDTIMYEFATGVAAGNIAEVGVANGPGPTGMRMFSRALVLDSGGNPTTVTVLSDEILRIYYELRWYIPETDSTGTVVLDGVTYDWTIRSLCANSVTSNQGWPGNRAYEPGGWLVREFWIPFVGGDLAAITASAPTGTQQTAVNPTCTIASAYVAGNYWVEYWVEFSTDQANVNITCFSFTITQFGRRQMKFSPPIPKTSSKKLRLKIRTTWARRSI